MTTETMQEQKQEHQPTPTSTDSSQQQEASEAKSFEAGFNDARGIEPPAEVPAKTEPATQAQATDEKPDTQTSSTEKESPAEKAATLIGGKPEAEVLALLEKVPGLDARVTEEIRKVYGKFGEIQGTLQKLQHGQSNRKIEASALKRLNNEFPEIAQMLADDLAEIFGTAPASEQKADTKEEKDGKDAPPKPLTEQEVETRVAARVDAAMTQTRQQMEKKLLTVLHPDWETVCKKPEFGEFLKTLPEADRNRYINSDDALVSAEAFKKFKEWKPPQKSGTRKQERLAAAITPSSEGSAPANTLDDEAAFIAGFKSQRGG